MENLSLSSNTDVALDLRGYVDARRKSGVPTVVAAELNANLPYMLGAAELARADLDIILDPPRPHFDLFAPPKEPVTLADHAMGLHAATMIKDGGTQFPCEMMDFAHQFIRDLQQAEEARMRRRMRLTYLGQRVESQHQRGQILSHLVMKFARNATTFFFLRAD